MTDERESEVTSPPENQTEFRATGLPLLYDSEITAGWTQGMARIVLSVLDALPLTSKPDVLELGCGSGAVVRTVRDYLHAASVAGLDLNPLALRVAAAQEDTPPRLLQGNLLQLPFAHNSFDLLLALDSFDQVGIPLHQALEEARRVLRTDGMLIMRVSAYPWLLGKHDAVFGTGRRYDRDEVELALAAAGLRVVRTTFANTLLAPPVIAMRMAHKWLGDHEVVEKSESAIGDIYTSSVANRMVGMTLEIESRAIRLADFPFGLSLIVAAQKT